MKQLLTSAVAWALLFGTVYLVFTLVWFATTTKEADVPVESEWCLVDILDGGGSISAPSAGEYEYQVILTGRGIEVYQKCGKIN